jgi:hypothetical protein
MSTQLGNSNFYVGSFLPGIPDLSGSSQLYSWTSLIIVWTLTGSLWTRLILIRCEQILPPLSKASRRPITCSCAINCGNGCPLPTVSDSTVLCVKYKAVPCPSKGVHYLNVRIQQEIFYAGDCYCYDEQLDSSHVSI